MSDLIKSMTVEKYVQYLFSFDVAVGIILAVLIVGVLIFVLLTSIGKRMSDRNMRMIDKFYDDEEETEDGLD